MGMFSCYYFALVGSFPTRAECEKLGGCKKCRFYLEEPGGRKGSNERHNGDKKTIVERECIVSKKCDVCGKDIPPLPRTFPQIYTPYYRITTYHNDWGNDSCESYDYKDAWVLPEVEE